MKVKNVLKTAGILLFWIVVWQLLTTVLNPGLIIDIPTPLRTLTALCGLAGTIDFWLSICLSLFRIITGYCFAAVFGIIFAVLCYKSSVFKAFTSPLVFITRSVPVASFIILVFLWLTKGIIPIFISFLMVLPIVWSNVETGLNSTDVKLKEMAYVMGLSKLQVFREITMPSVKPYLMSALVTGLGFAWKSGVAAEVIARTGMSLGDMLWVSKSSVDYDEVFAITVVILILSVLLENVLRLFLRGKSRG